MFCRSRLRKDWSLPAGSLRPLLQGVTEMCSAGDRAAVICRVVKQSPCCYARLSHGRVRIYQSLNGGMHLPLISPEPLLVVSAREVAL